MITSYMTSPQKLTLLTLSLALFLSLLLTTFQVLKASSNSQIISPARLIPKDLQVPSPTPTPDPVITIGLMGDLGLGRNITNIARKNNNFTSAFDQISPWLLENDLNIANLESTILADCPNLDPHTFSFCGDIRFLPQFQKHQFLLSIANNHIYNFGQKGYQETKDHLQSTSTPYANSHVPEDRVALLNINGISIAYLAFDFITNPNQSQQEVIDLVKEYDPQVDWLILSLHWGNEYLTEPEAWRQDFATELVDAGVDILHGHHPHVWQGVRDYQSKKIYYSFGNFIFDQSWSYNTSHSNIVRLTLSKDSILQEEIFPIEIYQNYQPRLMSP